MRTHTFPSATRAILGPSAQTHFSGKSHLGLSVSSFSSESLVISFRPSPSFSSALTFPPSAPHLGAGILSFLCIESLV